MIRTVLNVFRIPAQRKRARFVVLAAVLVLCIYRIGFYVPSPGVDQQALSRMMQGASGDEAVDRQDAEPNDC